MKKTKKLLFVVLMLAMVLSVFTACADTVAQNSEEVPQQPPAAEYVQGDKMEDFTVITHDGKEVSLYDILEQKDMVLLNFWATWCGPCGMEFPAMEEAYRQYKDQIEILAISTDPSDTAEDIADYAGDMGLTFLMAPDTIGISDRFPTASIPVSVVIDRFGTVCLIEGSAKTDSETFTSLFDIFIGDDYTESILLPTMNAELPSVEPASSEELSGALDSDLIFTNSTNPYNWPMTVAEKEGRTVLVSENCTCPGSVSALNTTVEAKAGDALVISFKMGAEAPMDRMTLFVNGEAVKYFGSTRDWGTYAHTFGRDGAYDVRICYSKEIYSRDKNAYLWIDSIQLLSGDEAAAALEQNPRYIVSPETSIQLLNEDARLVVVYLEADPDIMSYYYMLDGVWNVKATLDETVDPELTYFRDSQLRNYSLLKYQKEDGYYIDFTPPESESSFFLDVVMGNDYISLSGFVDEEAADELCALFKYYSGRTYCWKYADETVDTAAVAGDATYTITYTDQNGNPVQGVMCQVCDESTCQVFVSGSDGVCTITLPAGVYEIHTLKVPEGYEGDTATVTEAPVGGGELSFVLTKK